MSTKTAALKISVVCLMLTNVYVIEASFKRSIWNSRVIGLKRTLDSISEETNKRSYGYLFKGWPPRDKKGRYGRSTPPPNVANDQEYIRYDLLGYY